MNKNNYIEFFRKMASQKFSEIKDNKINEKEKIKLINNFIKQIKEEQIKNQNHQNKLEDILTITYATYIVMLEFRNLLWKYDYMTFSRRIGELWEPFCKIPFIYSEKVKIIEPPRFENIQNKLKNEAETYIKNLSVESEVRDKLIELYNIPWKLIDSGGIKLELDLHFRKNEINYNCDFKSGFSSNEKGNTNRLLLVGAIYKLLNSNEETILFVRENEEENCHYLSTLSHSGIWNIYCGDECYKKIAQYTEFNIKDWINKNMNWEQDLDGNFVSYLKNKNLFKYLRW